MRVWDLHWSLWKVKIQSRLVWATGELWTILVSHGRLGQEGPHMGKVIRVFEVAWCPGG